MAALHTLGILSTYTGTRRDPDADTRGRWFESLIFLNHPKWVGKRMAVDRQKVKTSSEIQKLRMQAGSRSGQEEWSGRREWSPENRKRSKLGGLVEENRK